MHPPGDVCSLTSCDLPSSGKGPTIMAPRQTASPAAVLKPSRRRSVLHVIVASRAITKCPTEVVL